MEVDLDAITNLLEELDEGSPHGSAKEKKRNDVPCSSNNSNLSLASSPERQSGRVRPRRNGSPLQGTLPPASELLDAGMPRREFIKALPPPGGITVDVGALEKLRHSEAELVGRSVTHSADDISSQSSAWWSAPGKQPAPLLRRFSLLRTVGCEAGLVPHSRCSHSLFAHRGSLWLYGGRALGQSHGYRQGPYERGNSGGGNLEPLGDLHRLDVRGNTWSPVALGVPESGNRGEGKTSGKRTVVESPGARGGHCTVALPLLSTVVLFGGADGDGRYPSDTWLLRDVADGWVFGCTGGDDVVCDDPSRALGPAGREQHAMAASGHDVYLFGGCRKSSRTLSPLNGDGVDLWSPEILLAQGMQQYDALFGDLWVYSVSANRWTLLYSEPGEAGTGSSSLDSALPGPAARRGAMLAVENGVLLLHGGELHGQKPADELWLLVLPSCSALEGLSGSASSAALVWRKIDLPPPLKSLRCGHSCFSTSRVLTTPFQTESAAPIVRQVEILLLGGVRHFDGSVEQPLSPVDPASLTASVQAEDSFAFGLTLVATQKGDWRAAAGGPVDLVGGGGVFPSTYMSQCSAVVDGLLYLYPGSQPNRDLPLTFSTLPCTSLSIASSTFPLGLRSIFDRILAVNDAATPLPQCLSEDYFDCILLVNTRVYPVNLALLAVRAPRLHAFLLKVHEDAGILDQDAVLCVSSEDLCRMIDLMKTPKPIDKPTESSNVRVAWGSPKKEAPAVAHGRRKGASLAKAHTSPSFIPAEKTLDADVRPKGKRYVPTIDLTYERSAFGSLWRRALGDSNVVEVMLRWIYTGSGWSSDDAPGPAARKGLVDICAVFELDQLAVAVSALRTEQQRPHFQVNPAHMTDTSSVDMTDVLFQLRTDPVASKYLDIRLQKDDNDYFDSNLPCNMHRFVFTATCCHGADILKPVLPSDAASSSGNTSTATSAEALAKLLALTDAPTLGIRTASSELRHTRPDNAFALADSVQHYLSQLPVAGFAKIKLSPPGCVEHIIDHIHQIRSVGEVIHHDTAVTYLIAGASLGLRSLMTAAEAEIIQAGVTLNSVCSLHDLAARTGALQLMFWLEELVVWNCDVMTKSKAWAESPQHVRVDLVVSPQLIGSQCQSHSPD